MAEWRRRTATVRFRVTVLATVAVALMLTVTAVALVLHQRRVLTEGLDEALALEAESLGSRAGEGQTELDRVIDDEGVVQIVSNGAVIASTGNLQGRATIAPTPTRRSEVRTINEVLAGEPPFRVASRQITIDGRPATIHVGAPLDDVNETTASLAAALAVAVPVVSAAVAALVWMLVGRTLAPVEGIRTEVAAIGAGDLHRRVPVPESDDEVGRLARTMNGMLDRLEDASVRQQQFVADASHELRSPLTRIRAEIEVDLADPDGSVPLATLRSVLDETNDLTRLVDDLLLLARAEASTAVQSWHPVDLDDIALRHVRRLRAKDRVTVDATAVSAAQVVGDAAQLSRAIGNLLENAVRLATTTVTIALGENDGSATLTVTDDGPGVPPEERERIFERFTRIDDARTRGAGGAGLGLAITRDIVERHKGTVTMDANHSGGARFVVRLPLARA